tara:strand:- start:254 stop:1852 length:1599 start_codon:yes stop_codon:yes gene_type:complete
MEKKISSFNLDLSSLPQNGETRSFSIVGNNDSEFILEITDRVGYYYNFFTNAFQATKDNLEDAITAGSYKGTITFPPRTADDYYNISLYAKPGTKHTDYHEVRFLDGSLDINSSIGSNSLLMKKIIYQYNELTLTISPFSLSGNVEVGSITSDTVTVARGKSQAKTKFEIKCSVTTAAKSYQLIRQPQPNDIFSYVEPVVGSAPITLPGEDIYPATVNGTSNTTTAATGDSAVSSSTTVGMEEDVSASVAVGDKVTGFALLAHNTIATVTNVSTSTLTISENVTISAGTTLTFTKQRNRRWPLNNYLHLAAPGSYIKDGTNITTISNYINSLTSAGGTSKEEKITKNQEAGVSSAGNKPTYTNGVITALAGNIIVSDPQLLVFAGNTIKLGGYGTNELLRVYGYDAVLSGLSATLTEITTTTTSAVANSTSVPVASRNGIISDDVSGFDPSVCSGIGVDASRVNPTVATGAGAVSGAGTIVLSAVQTLEKGRTLTFSGTGQEVTITGYIEIAKSGAASQTLRFDVDKFLSIT